MVDDKELDALEKLTAAQSQVVELEQECIEVAEGKSEWKQSSHRYSNQLDAAQVRIKELEMPLGQISRMRCNPDHAITMGTLAAAITLARAVLAPASAGKS